MTDGVTPQSFASSVLRGLGIPQTPGAVQALVGWAKAEGGHWANSARYNPLNTTEPMPGAGNTGVQGNIKVYRNWDQGVQATVKTLQSGMYGGILLALRAGDPLAAANAIGRSKWGTSTSLARSTIMGTPRVAGAQPISDTAGGAAGSATGGSQTLDAGGGAPAQDASTVTPADVLAALRPAQPAVQASPIQAPFSATQTYLHMPAGYHALAPSPPPQAPNIDAALALASQVMGPDVGQAGLSATVPTGALGTTSLDGTGPAGGRLGQITVASGANLPGHPLTPAITTFARMVAGQFGQPLTIGTGTNHPKNTINGTVSDHYSGNAVDIPATGQRLHQIGLAALLAAGVPQARARAEAARGGGFDVPWQGGRLQVIFATNAPGWGDHTTHAHLGFSPGR